MSRTLAGQPARESHAKTTKCASHKIRTGLAKSRRWQTQRRNFLVTEIDHHLPNVAGARHQVESLEDLRGGKHGNWHRLDAAVREQPFHIRRHAHEHWSAFPQHSVHV